MRLKNEIRTTGGNVFFKTSPDQDSSEKKEKITQDHFQASKGNNPNEPKFTESGARDRLW